MVDHEDKYWSASQIAQAAGTDLRWVARQARRLALEPDLFKGERQWNREKAIQLILLARMQGAFGESSPIPFDVVEREGPQLVDRLLHDQVAATNRYQSGLLVSVSVPTLALLLG